MSQTVEVKVGFVYADGETKNYTIPEVDVENLGNVKTRIQDLNTVFGGGSKGQDITNYALNMQSTFVSSGGAALSRIGKASIEITEEEVIYGD